MRTDVQPGCCDDARVDERCSADPTGRRRAGVDECVDECADGGANGWMRRRLGHLIDSTEMAPVRIGDRG